MSGQGKRNTLVDDSPRRIDKKILARMHKHISDQKKNQRTNFNKFLGQLLDLYEELQKAETVYAVTTFKDVAEARGEAIMHYKSRKEKYQEPKMVVVVGDAE